MTVHLKIKDFEVAKEVWGEVLDKYVSAVKHSIPAYFKNDEIVILSTSVEQSILDEIIEQTLKRSRDFFSVFEPHGYVRVGSWLYGKDVNAREYIEEVLKRRFSRNKACVQV